MSLALGGAGGRNDITSRSPAIEMAAVSYTYDGPPPVTALSQIDLAIEAGDYVTVVGPSGSGKSTFLNLAGLLDRPTGGRVLLEGIDAEGLTETERAGLRARRIGFVFQAFHLLPYRTAAENVMLAQCYTGAQRRTRRAASTAALTQVGLGTRCDALPGELSGGERQRVAIARALVNRPALLLCDEPTGNLDTATAGVILDLLDDLHRDGLTLVVITHNPAVAARGRRSLEFRDGHLVTATTQQ